MTGPIAPADSLSIALLIEHEVCRTSWVGFNNYPFTAIVFNGTPAAHLYGDSVK